MPDPSPAAGIDSIVAALSRRSNDQRRTVTQYANLEPRVGNTGTPPRLLSDIGFQETIQFSYLNAHPAHVIPPDDEEPRTIRQIVVCAYGLELDRRRFTSRQNRTIRTQRQAPHGVAPHPDDANVLVSAELDDFTNSAEKQAVTPQNMTTRGAGPAYHFLIDRLGNISVGPALDYKTTTIPARHDDAIFVGLEGALGILRADYLRGLVREYFELPYTDPQIDTLVVLLAKLYVAFPEIRRNFDNTATPGVLATVYTAGQTLAVDKLLNFSNGAWRNQTKSPFQYYRTDDEPMLVQIDTEGSYDLATEIFRTAEAPRALAARDEARVAIGQLDTAGQTAIAMGAYLRLAAPERSSDMQGQSRRELFVSRERMAHSEAAQTGVRAATTNRGAQTVTPIFPQVSNFEPHVYDYSRGVWGDGTPY
jgi:hypothetical protein